MNYVSFHLQLANVTRGAQWKANATRRQGCAVVREKWRASPAVSVMYAPSLYHQTSLLIYVWSPIGEEKCWLTYLYFCISILIFFKCCIWKDAIGQMGLYCCIVLKLLYISGWILEPWSDAWRLSGLWLWSRRVEKPYMWPRDRTVWLPSSHHGTKMW